MDIVLIPGLWLDGSSWDAVVTPLERTGHRVQALTLPGMASAAADRSGVTLADHVGAVVDVIDRVDGANPVLLVGHSAGCALAYAATDARPDRVARLVLVGGFPTPDGATIADGFAAEGNDVPLPDWSAFDDSDLVGLDAGALAQFRTAAVPSPAAVVAGTQRLGDERRRDVPCTAVCTEYTPHQLRGWIESGAAPVSEFAQMNDVGFVGLPTGHWPQFSRPLDLARLIDSCTRLRPGDTRLIDEVGRLEPPAAGDELETLLGFLDYQRGTLDWKCAGTDAEGLRTKVADSDMTLGGLLKHMTVVEDHWFSRSLHDAGWHATLAEVDWDADPDWDWNSAASDRPEQLAEMWHASVLRSRERTVEALADGGLGTLAKRSGAFGTVNLRWIITHMIEEYARHNGHADLLREAVDGATGE